MRKFLFAVVAVAGLGLMVPAMADDAKKGESKQVTGVLIDNACGDKQKDQESAAKHPIGCAKKDGCAASGYQVVHGEKHHKFDEKGNELAKAYLADAKSTTVVVIGTLNDDGTIAVTEIKAAEEEEGQKDSK